MHPHRMHLHRMHLHRMHHPHRMHSGADQVHERIVQETHENRNKVEIAREVRSTLSPSVYGE